jgi:hypothetical protein
MVEVPHDLTDEQLNELSALVTLFDIELSETLEALLLSWAAETRMAEKTATSMRRTVTAIELDDLAERLSTARGDKAMPDQRTRGRRRSA